MKKILSLFSLMLLSSSFLYAQTQPVDWSWDYSDEKDPYLDLQISDEGFIETNSSNVYSGKLVVTLAEGLEFNSSKDSYFSFDGAAQGAEFVVAAKGNTAVISLKSNSLELSDNASVVVTLNPKSIKGKLAKGAATSYTAEFHKQTVATTFTSPVTGRTYSLIFNDEFNDEEIDSAKWDTRSNRSPFTRRGEYEGQPYYVMCHDDWTKEVDGMLRLEVSKYPTQKNVVMTGGILTLDRFMTKYGYYETEVSFEDCKGEGYWPAFWLHYAEEDGYTTGTEIDIFEYIPAEKQIFHTLHWYETEPAVLTDEIKVQHLALTYDKSKTWDEHRSTTKFFELENATKGTHTFAVEWTPDELIFYTNGEVTRHLNKADYDRYVPSAYEMVFFSCSGGEWGGNVMKNTEPAFVYFDYCRCYQELDQDAIYTFDGEEVLIKASDRQGKL